MSLASQLSMPQMTSEDVELLGTAFPEVLRGAVDDVGRDDVEGRAGGADCDTGSRSLFFEP